MRHRLFGKKLNRDYDHRRALLKNLARAFFSHQGKIETTLAKAKAVQPLIERMISKAIKGDLVSRRWLFRYFQDQHFVNHLVAQFGRQLRNRKGGYTRIIKLERRKGDDALIVRLELVEEIKEEKTKEVKEEKEEKSKKSQKKEAKKKTGKKSTVKKKKEEKKK